MMTAVLISSVIITMLIPLLSASNILAATPLWLRMPTPDDAQLAVAALDFERACPIPSRLREPDSNSFGSSSLFSVKLSPWCRLRDVLHDHVDDDVRGGDGVKTRAETPGGRTARR